MRKKTKWPVVKSVAFKTMGKYNIFPAEMEEGLEAESASLPSPTDMASDRGYLQEETDWKGGSGTLLVAAPKSKDQQNQTT